MRHYLALSLSHWMYLHFAGKASWALTDFLFLLFHSMDRECLSNYMSISCNSSSTIISTAHAKTPTRGVISIAIRGNRSDKGTFWSMLLKKKDRSDLTT
jgi:hypothetical protein